MSKLIKLFSVAALLLWSNVRCKADTIAIDKSTYRIHSVSSELADKPATNAIDNDEITYWGLNNGKTIQYPAWVIIDLGEEKAVNGLSYLPNGKSGATRRSKATYYSIYVSNDTVDFGDPLVNSMYVYEGVDECNRKNTYFGAVTGRYVKLAYHDNYHRYLDATSENKNIHTNDIVIYEDTDGPASKKNQLIDLEKTEAIGTSSEPFELVATSPSGNEIKYELIKGPASIDGNTCTLTGSEGVVDIKATVAGNNEYLPGQKYFYFNVINTASFEPKIVTSLTEKYPIYMNELKPYKISFKVEGLPSYIKVDSAVVIANNISLELTEVNGGFVTYWQPAMHGFYGIKIKVFASNGNTDEITMPIQVKAGPGNITVRTLSEQRISGGAGVFEASYELPQFVGAYNKIIGHLYLGYPDDGTADIWDRVSRIWVRNNTSPWIEIIRYLTPYYKACDHSIDLTDYASLLQGNVEVMVWIEGGGKYYLYTLDFEYVAGEPDYPYSQVQQLWSGRYNFGNYSNLQPVPEKKVTIGADVLDAKLNLVTTGHGWSSSDLGSYNTGNAAEFHEANHKVVVNGTKTFDQHLWTNCNPNPDGCSPQQGTWQYPRAGWCPGSIAALYEYELGNEFNANDEQVDTLTIDYVFQEDYVDLCHPNHPNCVTGENSCIDCNNGYNPYYYVSCNLVKFLYTPEASDETMVFVPEKPMQMLKFKAYPNISCGELFIDAQFEEQEIVVEIVGLNGAVYKNYFFDDAYALNNYVFELSDLNGGFYLVRVTTQNGYGIQKIILE